MREKALHDFREMLQNLRFFAEAQKVICCSYVMVGLQNKRFKFNLSGKPVFYSTLCRLLIGKKQLNQPGKTKVGKL